jgi:DNA-binding response OmpR family regulator
MATAHDGLAALAEAAEFRPEVVVLDIGLPGLNGYEVAREIRRLEWGAGIGLIALTGWGQDNDREKSAAAGFDTHLVKPVDYDALVKRIADLP